MTRRSALFAAAVVCAWSAAAMAATAPPFPSKWLNSEPMTVSALKGKVTVLYFYEEG